MNKQEQKARIELLQAKIEAEAYFKARKKEAEAYKVKK